MIEPSADAYRDNRSYDVTAIAAGVGALGKIGTPAADRALVGFIDPKHTFAYRFAIEALGNDKTCVSFSPRWRSVTVSED